ncbi:uncharacterized protein LOC113343019 [Papaver somniferum]|uniref:uncharacterized protein LOC113343019 n=1 Tax=Papaver somniferum TaxID=3469 RepID=UPI000E6F7045|nr:uncharacterized protein LOC113343019 [Papaver somniferum]
MEKAFDNVSWNSLFYILKKNVFGDRWIKWISWCVTQAQFSILVLSMLMNDVVASNTLSGFQVVDEGTITSHQQFVDDTIVLLNASKAEVRILLIILMMFEVLTGLKLNLKKIAMTSIGADDLVQDLSLELGCKIDSLLITYL